MGVFSGRIDSGNIKQFSTIGEPFGNHTVPKRNDNASPIESTPPQEIVNASLDDELILHITPKSIKKGEHTPNPRRRPLLYVNFMHTWFHDPKNWDDNERLFQ